LQEKLQENNLKETIKKDEKKKDDVVVKREEETKIVYVKDKVQLDQYLRDEGPRNYQKLMDMAKKAEETEFKKSNAFPKIKRQNGRISKEIIPIS